MRQKKYSTHNAPQPPGGGGTATNVLFSSFLLNYWIYLEVLGGLKGCMPAGTISRQENKCSGSGEEKQHKYSAFLTYIASREQH